MTLSPAEQGHCYGKLHLSLKPKQTSTGCYKHAYKMSCAGKTEEKNEQKATEAAGGSTPPSAGFHETRPLLAAPVGQDASALTTSVTISPTMGPMKHRRFFSVEKYQARGISPAPWRREMNWQMEGYSDKGVFINIT